MYSLKTFQDLANHIKSNVANDKFLNYLQNGSWKSYSSSEFISNVKKLANGLKDKGVGKGTTVAILVPSSPQWLIMDYALQLLGAVSVPIFSNISSKNLSYELKDADIKYAFVCDKDCSQPNNEFLKDMKFSLTLQNLHSFISQYEEIELFEEIAQDDIATIIYTSGSTGIPKGVELSHKNIITNIYDTKKNFILNNEDSALSFLPLAHIFERMIMNFYLLEGVSVYFADDVKNVPNLLKEVNPSLMTLVPRLLEKIDIVMHQKALSGGFFKKMIATLAFKFISKDIDKNCFIYKLFDKLVFSKFRQAFGENMRMLICGGARLDYKNELFFKNIGMDIYQGYGLSETSPVICANTPFNKKDKTCGQKFDSVEIKLTHEDELIVRGSSVFKSYHNIEKSPLNSDGWFHTGDLASIDSDGYVSIDGRINDLLKTSNAKFVSALSIEQSLTHNSWIDYAVIVAQNKKFVSALLFLDPIFLRSFASLNNIEHLNFTELIKNEKVISHISEIVSSVNKSLNHWEKIKKYELITDVPTIESGVLTPSMKISRKYAYEKYNDIIEDFYGENYEKK